MEDYCASQLRLLCQYLANNSTECGVKNVAELGMGGFGKKSQSTPASVQYTTLLSKELKRFLIEIGTKNVKKFSKT